MELQILNRRNVTVITAMRSEGTPKDGIGAFATTRTDCCQRFDLARPRTTTGQHRTSNSVNT